MKKVVMIGNGLDLAHGLKTRYLDFFNWLYKKDRQFVTGLNDLLLRNFMIKQGYIWEMGDWRYSRIKNDIDFFIESLTSKEKEKIENSREFILMKEKHENNETWILYGLWSSLEAYLYYVYLDEEVVEMDAERESLLEVLEAEDYGQVIDEDLNVLYRPGLETYKSMKQISFQFQEYLFEWVDCINDDIDEIKENIFWNEDEFGSESINLLSDDFFDDDIIINFNYSHTIEALYEKHCYHFHGCYDRSNPPLMGHDGTKVNRYFDERALILVNDFYKKTTEIIEKYRDVYEQCKDADMIVVLGLGYNETDLAYFQKIYEICKKNVKWQLYYYNDQEKYKAIDYVKNIGVKEENIKTVSIKNQSPYTKVIRLTQ